MLEGAYAFGAGNIVSLFALVVRTGIDRRFLQPSFSFLEGKAFRCVQPEA